MSKKYSVNSKHFDKIDTENKAYILGLFYADGCNNYPAYNSVEMALKENDKEILEKINKEINNTYPLKYKKGRDFIANNKKSYTNPQYRLIISDKNIAIKLSEHGMVKRKTLVIRFPKIIKNNTKLIRHFIRGYFDGDGTNNFRTSFYTNEKDLSSPHCSIVSGSEKFIKDISKIVTKLKLKHKTYRKGKSLCFCISFDGVDAFKFMDWMYCGKVGVKSKVKCKMFLKRKMDNYINNKKIFLKRSKNKYIDRNGGKGVVNNKAKLTERQVRNIFNSNRTQGIKLAKQYNVSKTAIYNIWKRKTWSHLNFNN